MSLTHTHFIWALQSQLTGLARSKLFAVGRHVLGGHIWEHLTNGTDGYTPFIPWLPRQHLQSRARGTLKAEA